MARAAQFNVKLTVLTNGYGATDEPLAHLAYSRYRRAMLKLGVNIYELSPTLSRQSGKLGDFRSSFGRLHAKVAVIDRQRIFIGSLNLDGRSARVNTEMGLLIDSPQLAKDATGVGGFALNAWPSGGLRGGEAKADQTGAGEGNRTLV